MKYQEYDSPFELTMSDITTQFARQIDEECWQAVQRVGINVDKDKLLTALRQDAERYREAYAKGYETGYTKRDDEIVRCKNCEWNSGTEEKPFCMMRSVPSPKDWFCADGERRTDNA